MEKMSIHQAANRVGDFAPSIFDTDERKKHFKPYKIQKNKLIWYVFCRDYHSDDIVALNIFDTSFGYLAIEAKRKHKEDFNAFAEEIKNKLCYLFWAKYEYETVITTWPPYIDESELIRLDSSRMESESDDNKWKSDHYSVNLVSTCKIDIYTQIMMNYDRFIEYLWNNRHLLSRKRMK